MLKFPRPQFGRVRHPDVLRTYATPFPHDSCRQRKLLGTIFLMVDILNRREIPHRLESHNECNLRTARRPYNVLTTVAQRTHPTYGQMPLRRTDRSRTMNVQPDVPMTY